MNQNVVFSVTVGADRGIGDPLGSGLGMDTLREIGGDGRMTSSAGFRDMRLAHGRFRVDSVLHVVASMAVHAVGRLPVAGQQGSTVDTSLIGGDESGLRGHACPDIRIVEVAGETDLFLGDLRIESVPVPSLTGQRFLMALETVGRPFHSRRQRFSMLGSDEMLGHLTVALSTGLGKPDPVELGARELGRGHLMGAVTLLTALAIVLQVPAHPWMKRVQGSRVPMAGETAYRPDPLGVGNLFRIQIGMAIDTGKRSVGRLFQEGRIDGEGHNPTPSFHGERGVRVTGKTVLVGLSKNWQTSHRQGEGQHPGR